MIVDQQLSTETIERATAELRISLDNLHKKAAECRQERHERDQQRRLKKPGVKMAEFEVGEYLLMARNLHRKGEKLLGSWKGPVRVTKVINSWIYEAEDLIQGNKQEVHAQRLKHYADADLELTSELYDAAAHSDEGFEVEALEALTWDAADACWKVKVSWRGLDRMDSTWEPIENLVTDVPELVRNFLIGLRTKEAA